MMPPNYPTCPQCDSLVTDPDPHVCSPRGKPDVKERDPISDPLEAQARASAEREIDRLKAENERLTELRQRGCDCSDEDACRFARERDEARAENERLREALKQISTQGTRKGFSVHDFAWWAQETARAALKGDDDG